MTLKHLCCIKYLTFVIFALLLLPFIFSNNVFADSNPTVTFTGGVSVANTVSWFPNCDATCFSQYKYLKITSTSAPNINYYSSMRLYFIPVDDNLSGLQPWLNISTETYYKIDDIPLKKISFAQNTTPAYDFTAELVSDLSEPCPEPEPCNCDIPPIVQFFKETFFNIVLGIIPAFGIFAVVWFMVDLLSSLWFGRGK